MPQPKRARRALGPRSSVAAAADHQPHTGGWLSGRRNPSESRRAEDDGTSLTDEILLFIFATFLEITDLVRCAATCRRWRRLVSGEAAFICRGLKRPGPGGRFIPALAVGFFHQLDVAATRFVPMASASRRFPVLREPSLSLSTLVGGGLPDSSRIVASRNGLLVLGKMQMRLTRGGVVADGGRAAYWMTNGAVFELRLDTLEAKMASLPKRGGAQAFMTRNTALGMTPEGKLCVVHLGSPPVQGKRNDAVGSPPVQDERHDAVGSPPVQGERHDAVEIRLFSYDGGFDSRTTLKEKKCFPIKYRARADENLPSDARSNAMVKLQWFCEKSGVVFFTAGKYDDPRSDLYAVSLGTHPIVEKVASNEGDGSLWLWGNLYGYEMDQAAYLASLAEPEKED
ncbi:hypothetical protein C2845_PM13G03770 [Panicum miliaceum]|uniref:F-box domain-containing protein n=1 Tax=Panicum miliaceum TaxID=4540 RepID=A0A3L6RJH2_PANMI|nr:hypothetical protein C2845_PM13G03770 [Panicum miliaceum]